MGFRINFSSLASFNRASLNSSSFTARAASASTALFRPNIADRVYTQNLSQAATSNRSFSKAAGQVGTLLAGLNAIASQISSEVDSIRSNSVLLQNESLGNSERAALATRVEVSLRNIVGLTQTQFKGLSLEKGVEGLSVKLGQGRDSFGIKIGTLNSADLGITGALQQVGNLTSGTKYAPQFEALANSISDSVNAVASRLSAYQSALTVSGRAATGQAAVAEAELKRILL